MSMQVIMEPTSLYLDQLNSSNRQLMFSLQVSFCCEHGSCLKTGVKCYCTRALLPINYNSSSLQLSLREMSSYAYRHCIIELIGILYSSVINDLASNVLSLPFVIKMRNYLYALLLKE